MKYNEFVALSEHLEKEGTSLNRILNEVEGVGSNINTSSQNTSKDEDKIKTDRVGKGINSPNFLRVRTKLNNNARKSVKYGKKKIIEPYAGKIIGSLKKLANKLVGLKNDGKTPEEILQLGQKIAQQATNYQDKAGQAVDKTIDIMLSNAQKRVDTILSKSELSEKNQLALSTYWALLELQVKQILFKNLVKAREDAIEQMLSDDPELKKILDKLSGKTNIVARIEKINNSIKKQKEDAKKQMEDDKKQIEAGGKYKYKNNKGEDKTIIINSIDKDGDVNVSYTETPDKSFAIKKDRIGEKLDDTK